MVKPRKVTKKVEEPIVDVIPDMNVEREDDRPLPLESPLNPVAKEEPVEEPKLEVADTETPVILEEKPKKLPRGMVQVKVLIGTLSSADGTYEKGDIFTASRKQLAKFDSRYYQILS